MTPSATIGVSGRGTQAAITTLIADSGNFGTVALGAFRDQPLVITNPGGCPLTVTNITSSSGDFLMAQVVNFPFTVAPGASVAVPIRFQPTGPGAKAGTLTISNSDPLNANRVVNVSGTGGSPVIATSVVDTGNFGEVCVGATRDLNITITNSGTSPLSITNITSSSPEFQVPQVLAFPLLIIPGTSLEVPIRFAPTTPGPKSANITIASNDPVTPNKVVTLTATTPDSELCHPPSFTSVGMSIGPVFGSSKTGSWTYTGQGRHLFPFGDQHSFGVQVQGEFLYYHTQHDGQVDVGLVNRWKKVQLGVFSNIKFAEEDAFLKDGGTLGQASAVLDIFFTAVRLNIFATKGFKDIGVLNEDTSYAIAGGTALPTTTQDLARVADTLGAGVLFAIGPNDDIEGSLAWLRRAKPTALGDRAGVMARYTHHFNPRVALFGEFTLNEVVLGPTNNGRVIVGFVFGRWTRPSDLSNKHTPLGTEVPRVHYDLAIRQR